MRDLAGTLAGIGVFSKIGLEYLRTVEDDLAWVDAPAGESLIAAGGAATNVLAVVEGRVGVTLASQDHEMGELGPGAILGEAAVTAGGTRTSTITAITRVTAISIGADAFRSLLDRHPDFAREVASGALLRLRRSELNEYLTALFGALDHDALGALQEAATWMHLAAGKDLFEEGDVADTAYVVLSGRLRVTHTDHGEVRFLRELGSGQLVGETALLEETDRTATVSAIRDTELAVLPKTTFDSLVDRHPQAMLQIVRSILGHARTKRVRDARAELSMTIVATRESIELRVFASQLADALRSEGETTHLWSARVDSLLNKPGIAQSAPDDPASVRLRQWLQGVEHESQFVLFEVDADISEWTRRTLRQTDIVLLVTDAREGPEPTRFQRQIEEVLDRDSAARRAMVVVQDPSTADPQGTAQWLNEHGIDEHYHLREGSKQDVDRLARMLIGKGTGLVLSGGGARGFAHLGVIQALNEAGIAIDVVGGASMGGVLGTLVATETPVDEMVAFTAQQFRKLLDYTVPVVALLKGDRIVRAMDDRYAGMGIEDLWKRYFCISTNLTKSTAVVHHRGPLTTALRATVAIPGLLPPVPYGDDYLVDGGVLNNLPLDEMRAITARGKVIAVDVAPKEGPRVKADYGLSLSGAQVMRNRLRRGKTPEPPGIARTLLRSMIIGSMRDRDRMEAEGLADLYLGLDLRGVDLLDFDAVEEVAKRGYEAAAPRIEAWMNESSS